MIRTPNTSKLWSLGQLESFLKDLIEKCGSNGGIIIVIKIPDKIQIKEMQAMLNSFRKYGRY